MPLLLTSMREFPAPMCIHNAYNQDYSPYTLSQSCLKVHVGVPIELCIFSDPLVLRINCLDIRE